MNYFVVSGMLLLFSLSTVRAQSVGVDPDTLVFQGDITEVKTFLFTFTDMGGANVTITPPPGFRINTDNGTSWYIKMGWGNLNSLSLIIYVKFEPGASWGRISITSPAGTSYVTLCDVNSLPVQLISFAGAYNASNNAVHLTWKTISETNNYGFEVQRKTAGESDLTTLPDGFVPGHGTSLLLQEYSFTDAHVGPGRSSYRLKQIDLDNTVHFTDAIAVEVLTGVDEDNRKPTRMSLEQNYPNPFNPSTTIRYGLPNKSNVTLTVFNTLGQQVAQLVNGDMEAGYHEVKFDGSKLASGIYLYRMQAGSYVETKKLLLVR